ncbi:MAG: prolipoprotein diacylglyceryl transferase [Clostridia bacterium]|nr:prolipoprotein diacylglyceryl transferase [Clostridia bacterium]
MISFPGLGIGPFSIDPVAFKIFGLSVRWYGVLICIGMILAMTFIMIKAKYEKIKSDDMIDISIFTIIFSIIGARIYYVLFELDNYIVKGDILATLKKMVAIWEGGIAIYGALIAGFITIFVMCRIKKLRFATVLDVVAPGVMIGQIIGRWGNFVNMEAYGTATDLPWRMWLSTDGITHHPTFLYESLWNLIGFILIVIFYKKKKFHGQVFLFYMAWYGFGRMFIEGLRTDSLYLRLFGLDVRISQVVGFVTFVLGAVLMIVNFVKVKKYNDSRPAPAYYSEDPETSEPAVAEAAADVAEADDTAADSLPDVPKGLDKKDDGDV